MYNYGCAMDRDPDLDLVTAVHLGGLALVAESLRRLHAAGFPDLRTSHGFVIQHVVEGPRTAGEMARRMGISQQGASKAVGELVRLGYLERAPAPGDARVRLVGLSARGWEAVRTTRRLRAEVEAELVEVLGPDRAAALHGAALAALEWAGGAAAVRERRVPGPG
jgi:DNA-binding MarR family transcriptional regulator